MEEQMIEDGVNRPATVLLSSRTREVTVPCFVLSGPRTRKASAREGSANPWIYWEEFLVKIVDEVEPRWVAVERVVFDEE